MKSNKIPIECVVTGLSFLTKKDLAQLNENLEWIRESGEFKIVIGNSSSDI